jgi:hypothetical protein
MLRKKCITAAGSLLLTIYYLLLTVLPVHAAGVAYSAVALSSSAGSSLRMNIGETKTITIAFQNTGTSTWKNAGTNYISLYTHGPKYRTSAFQADNWISATQVSRMPETSVAPSESGTMTFSLEAPSAPGTYKETFALAAESLAWVQGGEVTLSITVTDPQVTSTTAASHSISTTTSAARTFQSATSARAKSGSIIPLAVTFQNTGTSTWHDTSLIAATGAASGGTLSNFANSSWQKNTIAAKSQTVNPGQTVTLDGYLSAPAQIDRVWEAFWTGGLSNPLTVIEQMTYLLFIKC